MSLQDSDLEYMRRLQETYMHDTCQIGLRHRLDRLPGLQAGSICQFGAEKAIGNDKRRNQVNHDGCLFFIQRKTDHALHPGLHRGNVFLAHG